jgi:CheY-like chemotaxis protein
MDVANGIDFLEQLVQKGCRQRHFALISGKFSQTDFARASRLGCKLFHKPVDIAQLSEWIEEVEKLTPLERTLFDWQYSQQR